MANEFMLFLQSQGVAKEDYNLFSTRKKQNIRGIFSYCIMFNCFNEYNFCDLAKLEARQLNKILEKLEAKRYTK